MKLLTAILLMLSLVLPASAMSQAAVSDDKAICTVTDEDGAACCPPAAVHCCCATAPAKPAPPVQQPTLPTSTNAKDIAATLPVLLFLTELPRLSASPAKQIPARDHASPATAQPVRLCVLRCRLLL